MPFTDNMALCFDSRLENQLSLELVRRRVLATGWCHWCWVLSLWLATLGQCRRQSQTVGQADQAVGEGSLPLKASSRNTEHRAGMAPHPAECHTTRLQSFKSTGICELGSNESALQVERENDMVTPQAVTAMHRLGGISLEGVSDVCQVAYATM